MTNLEIVEVVEDQGEEEEEEETSTDGNQTGLVFVSTVQQKPLIVINLGHTKSDNIIRIKKITDDFYLVIYSKWDFEI